MMPTLRIASEYGGERLDVVLARSYPQYSRVFLQKWVRQGGVRREGHTLAPSYRVQSGEVFEVADLESQAGVALGLQGASTPLAAAFIPTILFEDEALLAIDKPAGLVVHPAPSHRGPTLMDWVRDHLGPTAIKVFTDPERLGLVHRLDKDTSGVLVIAKSIVAQTMISRQFVRRSVRKIYDAFIEGVPSARKGVISAPVGRSRKQPRRMAVLGQGRSAETAFEVNEIYKKPGSSGGEVSQVSLFPKTGRTHQIRVHLAAIGHPIVGDRMYGSKAVWSERFAVARSLLHARRLELEHPLTRKPVSFEAPWPADFLRAQNVFRQAFKMLGIAIACGTLLLSPLRAQESATAAPKKPARRAATGTSVSSGLKLLKKDLAALKEQMDALKSELSALESALAELNAAKRLRDLEQAIPEMNAKSVSGANAAEESKSQILEANRKLKSLQEAVDQMRDQMDRLQREVILRRTSAEPAATSSSDGAGKQP